MADKTIHLNLPWRFERIYLRGAEIKLHDAPDLFDMKWQPQADMNIHGDFQRLTEHRYEVSLTLTLTCQNLDKIALELKLEQAALVRVQDESDPDKVQRMLAVDATNALFPYVREAVDNMALRMSLPPMMLGQFNFEKIFEESLRQMNLEAKRPSSAARSNSDEILN